jgi:nitronate monooxygenase
VFKGLQPILYAGREVWPLVEGGKGVSATNHASSGAWAAAGGIGTVSAVNADSYDPEGRIIPQVYKGLTRRERHEELVQFAIDGAVAQVERAYEIAGGKGAININVLWEMGGAQRVLHGVLERTKGMVAGVTCGAGMPYKLSEIAASYGVNYLPIISSGERSGRCGNAPTTKRPNGLPRWSTKTRGSRAAITACPMRRTRVSRSRLTRGSRSFAK